MCDLDTEDRKKPIEIDLLSSPKIIQKWDPQFLLRQNCWKVFSGKWELQSPNRVIYHRDTKLKQGESVAIIGSRKWNDFTLQARFKLLTDSIKPPEGGVILYFLFKNIRNYYSFHFCLFKEKVELIKRLRGVWSIIAEQDYAFETQKDYWITIRTSSGVHQCHLDGRKLLEITDKDISKGCVGIGGKYCDVEFSRLSVSISSNSFY